MSLNIIERLFECYFENFKPPEWILEYPLKKELLEMVICYYDKNSDMEVIKNLLTNREPTNIEMNRLYLSDKVEKYFGYTHSEYTIGSPNIAVYCKTPFVPYDIEQHRNRIKPKFVHVINVIGVALDDEQQPDYLEMTRLKTPQDCRNLYTAKVQSVFQKIIKCFDDHPNLKTIVVHGFGMGVFSKFAKRFGIPHEEIFIRLLQDFIHEVIALRDDAKIIINYLPYSKILPIIKNKLYFIRTPIDLLIDSYEQKDLESILFVNAWDPFSVVGNGNAGDNSLDGYFGRITAMSVLCWPKFNKKITYTSL